jgi:uncharacterized repeat protein (TIGR01451 family)
MNKSLRHWLLKVGGLSVVGILLTNTLEVLPSLASDRNLPVIETSINGIKSDGGEYKALPLSADKVTQSTALPAAPNVLLLYADDDNDGGSPIKDMLLSYGDLGSVDLYDARSATPTLLELQAYDVVVTWSNYLYSDPTGIGNVLADYVDAGGRVIDMMFALDPNYGYQGRFLNENYTAIKGASTSYLIQCLGINTASNPVMNGVTNVCDYYRLTGTQLTPGSAALAFWEDGEIFVGVKHRVVTIAAYPGYSYLWTGQLDLVIHNAILWQNSSAKILHIHTTDTTQSIQQALNELGYLYDALSTDSWAGIDFSPYDSLIVGMDGGIIEEADILAIRENVIDQGKRAIFIGGTCIQMFVNSLNQHLVPININSYCWKIPSTPHWTLTDPAHGLSHNLPQSHNFTDPNAAIYQVRVIDPDIKSLALNGDNVIDFFYKRENFPANGGSPPVVLGDFIWFINSPDSPFWVNQNDFQLLKQLLDNALTYQPEADLSITLIDNPDPISPGQDLSYTITVSNDGPDSAFGVFASDALPTGVTLVSITPGQGGCTGLSCSLGTIASGANATIDVVVMVGANAANPLENTADISSSTFDPNPSNNSMSTETVVIYHSFVSSVMRNFTPTP